MPSLFRHGARSLGAEKSISCAIKNKIHTPWTGLLGLNRIMHEFKIALFTHGKNIFNVLVQFHVHTIVYQVRFHFL